MHTWSRFDAPPRTGDRQPARAQGPSASLVDNAALVAKVAPVIDPPVEFLTVTVDGGFTF